MEDELSEAEERAVAMGIDLSLLDESMRMTPDERVRAHESALKLAEALAKAVEERNERLGKPASTP